MALALSLLFHHQSQQIQTTDNRLSAPFETPERKYHYF